MKRLILLLTFFIALNANSQLDTIQKPCIAVTNETKDTLYVVVDMYAMFLIMWDNPTITDAKPVIIPVTSLQSYYRRED